MTGNYAEFTGEGEKDSWNAWLRRFSAKTISDAMQTSRVNHVMSHVTVVTLLGEGGYDGTDRCALKVLLGFVIYANV